MQEQSDWFDVVLVQQMERVPPEILSEIFSKVPDGQTLLCAQMVCKEWCRVISSKEDSLWIVPCEQFAAENDWTLLSAPSKSCFMSMLKNRGLDWKKFIDVDRTSRSEVGLAIKCGSSQLSCIPNALLREKIFWCSFKDCKFQTFPNNFAYPKWISVLNLSNNCFTKFPPSLFHLSNLSQLTMTHNSLEEIPKEIASLKSLSNLNLSHNKITSVPIELFSLRLMVLVLNHNRITSLPTPMPRNSSIRQFALESNSLRSIPEEIGSWKDLFYLNLKNNLLETLPEQFANSGIYFLNVAHNPLKFLSPKFHSHIRYCTPKLSRPFKKVLIYSKQSETEEVIK